jgi:hypothetical protein
MVRAVFVRWITNMIAWQIGAAGTLLGLNYIVDPFIQVVLGAGDFLIDMAGYLFSGGDDDDEEMLKREIVEGVYETAFMFGTPFKQGTQILLRPDEQTVVDALLQGRIASQFGVLDRIVNTARVAAGQESEMTRKEQKNTLIDLNWFLDNYITGMGIVGPKRYTNEETDWTRLSYFLGEEDLTLPPHQGIFDEESPWMNGIQRWRTAFKQPHRGYVPLGHKIFKP